MTIACLLSEAAGRPFVWFDQYFVTRLDRGSVIVYELSGDGVREHQRWRAELWNAGSVVASSYGEGAVEAYSALVAALPRHWAAWLAQQCGGEQ